MAAKKYNFTPEIDKLIFDTYKTSTGKGEVNKIVKQTGIPLWRIMTRAKEIYAYIPTIKKSKWEEKELEILERNAHKQPKTIVKILRRSGFTRTANAVFQKRKKLKLLQSLDGYSAQNLAVCFGVTPKVVQKWIKLGYLRAGRRGTDRERDWYWITNKHIKQFILNYTGQIDIRKVDKYWFVDQLR